MQKGVHCNLLILDKEDCIHYSTITSFCHVNDKNVKNEIIKKYEDYNKMTDSPSMYDESFNKLKDKGILNWYPWIGENFGKDGRSVLLVGDSHYKHNPPTYLRTNYTREVIEEWGLGDSDKQVFIRNLRFALIGNKRNLKIKNDFWQKVAFYNFVQRPMKNSSTPPIEEDFSEG